MEDLFAFLNSIYPMSEGLTEYFKVNMKAQQFAKKDFLLKAGQISRYIYFIQRGLLRCFYIKDSNEISSWFMKEGDVVISIESFYQQKKSHEYIQALEDCSVYYITYDQLQYIYHNFMESNFLGRVLTQNYYTLWAQQLYGLRMQTSAERYKWLIDNFPDLLLRVPSKHLASYLGITEVTLSKIKGRQ